MRLLQRVLALCMICVVFFPSCSANNDREQTEKGKPITITVTVTDDKGKSTDYSLPSRSGDSLGDALYAGKLIEKDEYRDGFVTIVDGLKADWNQNQAWWQILDAERVPTIVGIRDLPLHDGDRYFLVYSEGYS